MLSNDFKNNECDKCAYIKFTYRGYVIICLYVDGMLIVVSSDDVILGIKITRTLDGCALSQSHYIEKILKKFDKDNTNAGSPVDINLYLSKNTGESILQLDYACIIGSLIYIMNCTRPDITYSVSRLSI